MKRVKSNYHTLHVLKTAEPSISPFSAAQPKAPLPKKKKKKKKRQKQKKREHPYEKWGKYRKKIREADIKRNTQILAIAEVFKNVLPETAFSSRLKSTPPRPLSHCDFQGRRRRRRRRHYLLRQMFRLRKRSDMGLRHIDLFPNSKKITTTMMVVIILSRKMYKHLAERT